MPTLSQHACFSCRKVFKKPNEYLRGTSRQLVVYSCPQCGHEDDVNGFLFLQPCAFSNLGFVFNGWGQAGFRQAFLDEFAERLGYPLAQVQVKR